MIMKTMKIILMVFVSLFIQLNAYSNEVKKLYNNTIIADSISKITVDFPSTIKVYESENDKTFMLISSERKWLLDSIYYDIDGNKLHIKSNDSVESLLDGDIQIYLYSPQNVDFNTSKYGLFVNVKNKNIGLANNGKQN